MKTTIHTLFATIAMTLTAAASPSLRIEVTIANSAGQIVSRPTLFVQSGKQATIATGSGKDSYIDCAMTPTLLDNGTVDIQTIITQRNGKKTDTSAKPRIVVQLGKLSTIRVGELVYTAKPSLAK